MVVYNVTWCHDSALSKGKGRAKNKESFFCFSVLCRNKLDAMCCLEYYFNFVFPHSDNILLDDGEVILRRSVVDSRNFIINYLMCDGIRQPIDLSDVKHKNVLRLNQIW